MPRRTRSTTSTRAARTKAQPATARMDAPPPTGSVGPSNYDFYEGLAYSGNRAIRPYFAVDSSVTLNRWTRERAMTLARWGYINVPFVKGAVDLMGRLTVGTGFSPRTHMPDKSLAADADAYYQDKASDIGFMHGESMDELLLHDSRGVDVDGDLGYIMTEDERGEPKLQLIEGHRIKNAEKEDSNLLDGVWKDQYGRRVAFNVALPGEDRSRRIEAKDFIYLAEHNRPDELRSMTNLIHALSPLQDLYEYLGFAMGSAKRNAEVAMVVETMTPNNPPIGPVMTQPIQPATAASGTPPNDTPAQPARRILREIIYGSGGKIPILRPGEKLTSFEPKNPPPGFDELPVFIIRGIGAGYGLPFEVFWNPEAIGGANTRFITALLRQKLLQRRHFIFLPKLKRVRFWILSKGAKKGDLPRADYTKHDWTPNFSDVTVDAGRESRERRQNVLNGLDSWTGYYRDNGEEYSDQLGVREEDILAQCAVAKRIVAAFPELSFDAALDRVAMLGMATTRETETVPPETTPPAITPPAKTAKK